MAASPRAGTSGRFQLNTVTPDLTSDVVDFSTAVAASRTAQASIFAWKVSESPVGTKPRYTTFESTANAQGVLAGDVARGGEVAYTVAVSGLYDTSETASYLGEPMVTADLVEKKAASGSQSGYKAVKARVYNFQVGDAVTEALASFSCELEVSGHLPAKTTNI